MPAPAILWSVDADGDRATGADWPPRRLPNDDDAAIKAADHPALVIPTLSFA